MTANRGPQEPGRRQNAWIRSVFPNALDGQLRSARPRDGSASSKVLLAPDESDMSIYTAALLQDLPLQVTSGSGSTYTDVLTLKSLPRGGMYLLETHIVTQQIVNGNSTLTIAWPDNAGTSPNALVNIYEVGVWGRNDYRLVLEPVSGVLAPSANFRGEFHQRDAGGTLIGPTIAFNLDSMTPREFVFD